MLGDQRDGLESGAKGIGVETLFTEEVGVAEVASHEDEIPDEEDGVELALTLAKGVVFGELGDDGVGKKELEKRAKVGSLVSGHGSP